VENAVAQGQGTLTTQPGIDDSVDGDGQWLDGRWSVVLLRDLSKPASGDVLPRPGEALSVAFAVWDGSAGDRNGSKSVTIWHQLELEQ
jgi:complex iron-sulfur molybdoenzyme family reductase subunit gamma